MDKHIDYFFQPKGLNEENQPLPRIILERERLQLHENDFEEVEVPFEILGTIVTNKASGFTGMAVQFIRHINGCFHITIQPAGILPKIKLPIRKAEFDIRECSGKMIAKLSRAALAESKINTPSPIDTVCEPKYIEAASENHM